MLHLHPSRTTNDFAQLPTPSCDPTPSPTFFFGLVDISKLHQLIKKHLGNANFAKP
jgi:hypothetical protein